MIATRLPGRTDNEIKNYWNTHLRKKLLLMGIDPVTHRPKTGHDLLAILPRLLAAAKNFGNLTTPLDHVVLRLQADAANLARFQILQSLAQLMSTSSPLETDVRSLLASASLQNYQFGDLLQKNRQLDEGLMNGSLSLPQNQTPIASGLPGLQIPQLSNSFQAHPESSNTLKEQEMVTQFNGSCSSTEHAMQNNGQSTCPVLNSYAVTTAHSTPSLVSTSPEHASTDQMQDPINSNASTPFEDWEGLNLDGLDNDLSWKDILDHISWSNAS